jgi:hypothetical protein
VTQSPRAAGAADPLRADGLQVGYLTEDGAELQVPLAQAWAVPFELGTPVRRFASRKGQRHLSGLWWSATNGGYVGFECPSRSGWPSDQEGCGAAAERRVWAPKALTDERG